MELDVKLDLVVYAGHAMSLWLHVMSLAWVRVVHFENLRKQFST